MSDRSHRNTGRRVSRPARRAALCAGALVLIVGSAAGCARTRAATIPQGPPLSVPAPPPRVVVPVEAEAPRAEAPPPTELPPAPPQPRADAPRSQPRPAPAETRTEPAPPAPVAPAAAATEKPSLQIAPSGGESAASEKGVATLLARYADAAKRVDRSKLNAQQRSNLQESQSFERRAREFLISKNYQAALAAADKANQLVEPLVK